MWFGGGEMRSVINAKQLAKSSPAGSAKSSTVLVGKSESYLSTQGSRLDLDTPTFAWVSPEETCTKTHNDSSKWSLHKEVGASLFKCGTSFLSKILCKARDVQQIKMKTTYLSIVTALKELYF